MINQSSSSENEAEPKESMKFNKSKKSQKPQKSNESEEEVESPSAEDVNEFSAGVSAEQSSKETEVKPFGTTFYVYAEVHKELPEVQFIVDTGAGVSLLPQKVFEQIPLEDRPQLTPAERHVYCGNEQGIRLAGIAYMKIH